MANKIIDERSQSCSENLETNLWTQPMREMDQKSFREHGFFVFRIREINDCENLSSKYAVSWKDWNKPTNSSLKICQNNSTNLKENLFGPRTLSPSTSMSAWKISSLILYILVGCINSNTLWANKTLCLSQKHIVFVRPG